LGTEYRKTPLPADKEAVSGGKPTECGYGCERGGACLPESGAFTHVNTSQSTRLQNFAVVPGKAVERTLAAMRSVACHILSLSTLRA